MSYSWKNVMKRDALQERKSPPRHLSLWARFTFKGIVLDFLYKHCLRVDNGY